jgi:hypothetical protein
MVTFRVIIALQSGRAAQPLPLFSTASKHWRRPRHSTPPTTLAFSFASAHFPSPRGMAPSLRPNPRTCQPCDVRLREHSAPLHTRERLQTLSSPSFTSQFPSHPGCGGHPICPASAASPYLFALPVHYQLSTVNSPLSARTAHYTPFTVHFPLQFIENTSTLSPLFATLTLFAPASPLLATLAKNRWGYGCLRAFSGSTKLTGPRYGEIRIDPSAAISYQGTPQLRQVSTPQLRRVSTLGPGPSSEVTP